MKSALLFFSSFLLLVIAYLFHTPEVIKEKPQPQGTIFEITRKDTNEDVGCYTYTLVALLNGNPIIMYYQCDSLLTPFKNQITVNIK